MVRVIFELTEIDEARGGGTWFIPGSHKANFPMHPDHLSLEPDKRRGFARSYSCPAGSAVFFTENSCHAGPIWERDDPRVMVLNAYSHIATHWNRREIAALLLTLEGDTLSEDERARLLGVAQGATDTLGSFDEGLRYAMTAILASPHFLYVHGAGDEGVGVRPYNDWEMASRLALFLWNSGPDDALLAAAAAGQLTDTDDLREAVGEMLADPRARRGLKAFADDWLGLDGLLHLSKDPEVFSYFSPHIGLQAREETLSLFAHLVLDEDADFRTLLTTRTTFVNRRLAALYGIPAAAVEGFAQVTLPEEGPRAGLLGHASVLALHASPNRSSPTLRGLFVRERLLCQAMPSPPGNVDTTIPESSIDAPTMRERLAVHLENESCAGCHRLTDLIGLGLERFDGLGGFREMENGIPIDPSGELDETAFADARSLGTVVADHPDFERCIVETLWSYANGRVSTPDEATRIDALLARFAASEHRLLFLLEDIAMSDGFRQVGEPVEEAP